LAFDLLGEGLFQLQGSELIGLVLEESLPSVPNGDLKSIEFF
jgi:hypothetical protein